MKTHALRLSIAVALTGFSALAWSQAPAPAVDVPKPNCGDLPEMPTKSQPDSRKRAFERTMRDYGACLQNYVKERNAAISAQQKATQAHIDTYNQLLQKYTAEKEEAAK